MIFFAALVPSRALLPSREAQVWQAPPASADEDIITRALSFRGSRPVRRSRGALVYHICRFTLSKTPYQISVVQADRFQVFPRVASASIKLTDRRAASSAASL